MIILDSLEILLWVQIWSFCPLQDWQEPTSREREGMRDQQVPIPPSTNNYNAISKNDHSRKHVHVVEHELIILCYVHQSNEKRLQKTRNSVSIPFASHSILQNIHQLIILAQNDNNNTKQSAKVSICTFSFSQPVYTNSSNLPFNISTVSI